MNGFYRGTTPTLKFTVNNASIAELGTPSVIISQDLVFIDVDSELLTVDTSANTVTAALTTEYTTRLTAGLPARVQLLFETEDTSIAFPIHQFDVYEALVESVLPVGEPESEAEEEEE